MMKANHLPLSGFFVYGIFTGLLKKEGYPPPLLAETCPNRPDLTHPVGALPRRAFLQGSITLIHPLLKSFTDHKRNRHACFG